MILETSFIIDFLRNESNSVSKMKELKDNYISIQVTSPSIFELWSGVTSLEHSESKIKKLSEFIQGQIILNLDAESAVRSGTIHGNLVKTGREIDVEDCMIAGIAMRNNIPVLAKDKHFKRIEGLIVEEY